MRRVLSWGIIDRAKIDQVLQAAAARTAAEQAPCIEGSHFDFALRDCLEGRLRVYAYSDVAPARVANDGSADEGERVGARKPTPWEQKHMHLLGLKTPEELIEWLKAPDSEMSAADRESLDQMSPPPVPGEQDEPESLDPPDNQEDDRQESSLPTGSAARPTPQPNADDFVSPANDTVTFHVPAIVAASLLVGAALGRWPIGYYQVLRIVTCASGGYIAFQAHTVRKTAWMWLMIAVAILFNPLAPIYMKRSQWRVVDLIGAAVLVVSVVAMRRKQPSPEVESQT